jgi:Leucine-rich repeat (LRR) protein
MMSHLCNRRVREFLILARTWFAFGLPSKTGCDIDLGENLLSGMLHPALFGNLTSLHLLDLSKNQFLDFELPQELGGMSSLR